MTATVAEVGGLADLAQFYAVPPHGVRANMIFSADGAAAFAGRAGPLSNPVDQELLRTLRGFADVVLVGAGTARAENYGPVRLTEAQQAERHAEGRPDPQRSRSSAAPAICRPDCSATRTSHRS